MVYMYHSFLIHSSADGHLGCFHVLTMINGMGNTCKPMAVSFQCMTKSTTIKKIIKKKEGLLTPACQERMGTKNMSL